MEDGEIEEGMMTEEEDAPPLDRSKPYHLLQQAKASVQDIVNNMLSIKKEATPIPKSKITPLLTQMFINFVSFRQANRVILVEEDRVKAETERAKAPVDFTTLQLHNLMYEKSHYIKAIKACKDFKSKYPNIQLVSEQDFLRDAPLDIKGSTSSTDSEHDLMLKRLNYEIYQRKELCKLRARLEQQKKSLLETVANRKKFLSSLPSHLKALKKASLPVQNQLGVLHTKKLKQHNSAELLPPPLYVIYTQLLAEKEAFEEHIDLEIVGSFKDAQTFARQLANKDSAISSNMESSRPEEDAPDEEDDGQRRRKRPKKVPSKESLDQASIYQVHPLKLIIYVYDNEASDPKSAKLVTLKFEYLLKLECVCVGVEGSEEGPESNFLCNLFPDDTGLELPRQSAKLIVGHTHAFDGSRNSRPYKWAQHLAGIDFLQEVCPLLTDQDAQSSDTVKIDAVGSGLAVYRKQNRVQTILHRIRSRKKAQLALMEQLDQLKKLEWPALTSGSAPWMLHTPLCSLHSWTAARTTTSPRRSLPSISPEKVEDLMDVDINGRSASPKEVVEEGTREDGELPSALPLVATTTINFPAKGYNLDHSRQLALISKSIISPITKGKSLSFKKYDDELELLLEDSDVDELVQTELDVEYNGSLHRVERSWLDYGVREFVLILSRKSNANEKNVTLEAKIKISMEYPLRPPLFALSLCGNESNGSNNKEGYNELRAMEAEVNLYTVKMVPFDEEDYMLFHQVRCLAMLFDYFVDDASSISTSEKRNTTSVVDVGLCKPVSGILLARSFRGRDRRKMISWKEKECRTGYPN